MLNKKKYTTIMSLLVSSALIITSCSVDQKKFDDAWNHLNENLNEAISESTVANEVDVEETEEAIETQVEVEPTETEAEVTPEPVVTEPVATATPTPTEIPAPERVDFSELTEDILNDTITVATEEFSESYVADDETLISEFSGSRMIILAEDATNVQVAVNLMLDGFYEEALGMYNRYTNEALAEFELLTEEDIEEFIPMGTEVNYEYGFNGRVLSVEMTYQVVREDDVIVEAYECVSFDLYTGSLVTLDSVIRDMDGFMEMAQAQLSFSYGAEEGEEMNFSDISIMARNDDSSVYICGTAEDGTRVRALVDINDYSGFMNRYGRIVF